MTLLRQIRSWMAHAAFLLLAVAGVSVMHAMANDIPIEPRQPSAFWYALFFLAFGLVGFAVEIVGDVFEEEL